MGTLARNELIAIVICDICFSNLSYIFLFVLKSATVLLQSYSLQSLL